MRAGKGQSMNIEMQDGRVFSGTAVQVVRAMQDIAFGVDTLTLRQYIEWVVDNALRVNEVELKVRGDSDAEAAASFIEELMRTGLAKRIDGA